MATVDFKRPLQVTQDTTSVEITTGVLTENAGKFYLPLVFDAIEQIPLAISEVDSTVGQSKLVGVAGAFDNVREGDIVTTLSNGTLTAKSTSTVNNCFIVENKKYIVYPANYNSGTLPAKAGDGISGSDIPSNTKIDRIDHTNRIIYLDKACTDSGVIDVTITPAVRVTAVRKSTATANPNQIDIDTTVATASADATLTVYTGTTELTPAILRIEPISNTVNSRLTFGITVAYPSGSAAKATATGLINPTDPSLNYVGLGTVGFDADLFLLNARIPRPDSID